MSSERNQQILQAVLWGVGVTALHFAVGTWSHALHAVHVVLSALYLVPVLVSAVAFERRGGLVAGLLASGIFLVHLAVSWRGSPTANLDQYAWPVVYVALGATAGQLVARANAVRREREDADRSSRRAAMVQGLMGLMTATGMRDTATTAHCRTVATIATRLGEAAGLPADVLVNLRLAALVHDIGKTGIPDDILFKRGPLTQEQLLQMRRHVDYAVHMLRAIPGTEAICRLVAQHHECPDGSGYPEGLRAHQIEFAASILQVADVFAALTEERPYHERMQPAAALTVMGGLAGNKLNERAFGLLQKWVEREFGLATDAMP